MLAFFLNVPLILYYFFMVIISHCNLYHFLIVITSHCNISSLPAALIDSTSTYGTSSMGFFPVWSSPSSCSNMLLTKFVNFSVIYTTWYALDWFANRVQLCTRLISYFGWIYSNYWKICYWIYYKCIIIYKNFS